jgi:ribose-phosphate pyrophosphokinase
MKIFYLPVLFTLGALLATPVWASKTVVIGVGNSLGKLESLLKNRPHLREYEVLNANNKPFPENGNSHVTLYDPETNKTGVKVVNREVIVILPDQMDYDELMETLLKVRSAKTQGATSVSVYNDKPLKGVKLNGPYSEELDLEHMLRLAGAKSLWIGSEEKPSTLYRTQLSGQTAIDSDFWVAGPDYPDLKLREERSLLKDEVAQLLGKDAYSFEKIKSNSELQKQLMGKKVYWFIAVMKPVNLYFFTALAQVFWLQKHGASVHLVSPYLPYARSDKPEFKLGATTQGKLAADLIKGMGAQAITVVRAHAPQSLGFFKIYAKEVSGYQKIIKHLVEENVECIVSPDAGFQKDATILADLLKAAYEKENRNVDVKLVVMNKQRVNLVERIIGGTGLEGIKGKKVVIVDDETASGNTLKHVAEFIKPFGPTGIFAMVTHLAGVGDGAYTTPDIERLIVTNTVPVQVKHEKVKVISVAEEVAQSILDDEKNR